MSKVIAYAHQGTTAIVVPADTTSLTIEEIAAKSVPQGTPYTVLDKINLPSDRVFRAAWTATDTHVVEEISAVKQMAHDYRRARRSALFAPLDAEIARQLPGSNPAAIEAQRQVIRDNDAAVQNDIDTAADVAEVRAVLAGYGAI